MSDGLGQYSARNMGKKIRWVVLLLGLSLSGAFASEADIKIPDLSSVSFNVLGNQISGYVILHIGLIICVFGSVFGLVQYNQTKNLSVHDSMRAVSNTIWETCKTYLQQ